MGLVQLGVVQVQLGVVQVQLGVVQMGVDQEGGKVALVEPRSHRRCAVHQ